MATLTTWFQQRNLFDPADGSFRSLSMSLTAASESEINCAGAEAVGSVTQNALDGVSVEGAIVKRKIPRSESSRLCRPASQLKMHRFASTTWYFLRI